MNYSYVKYNQQGQIIALEVESIKRKPASDEIRVEGFVDYKRKKVVNGILTNKTQPELTAERNANTAQREAEVMAALNNIKPEILAVKSAQPEVYELLKAIGILRPEVDQL